jgi:hypothetical protein
MQGSCAAVRACHQGARPAGSLNLTPLLAHGNLVNVAATSVPGWVRVVPGNPEASYLMVKLDAVDGPLGFRGTIMPPDGPVCAGMIGAVRRWIEAGAPGPIPSSPDAGGD